MGRTVRLVKALSENPEEDLK